MKLHAIAMIVGLLGVPSLALAQTPVIQEGPLVVRPVILDSDDDSGATVGLEYKLDGKFERDLSTSTALRSILLRYEGEGTITASADRNPKNFIDLKLSALGHYGSATAGSFEAGGFIKLEADQSFDNVQAAFGGRARYAKVGLLQRADILALDVQVGEVDPGDDEARKAALGVTKLSTYDRMEFGALYLYRIRTGIFTDVEFNYRRFQEIDAPARIRAAGLRVHELGTVRVGLKNDFFVAYSAGRLPFDIAKDQTVAIGLSYKLF